MKEFLNKPHIVWENCDARQKRDLYRYIFTEDLKVARDFESRTPKLSKIYQYLQGENEKTESLDSVNSYKWT